MEAIVVTGVGRRSRLRDRARAPAPPRPAVGIAKRREAAGESDDASARRETPGDGGASLS